MSSNILSKRTPIQANTLTSSIKHFTLVSQVILPNNVTFVITNTENGTDTTANEVPNSKVREYRHIFYRTHTKLLI